MQTQTVTVTVEQQTILTDADFEALRAWARTHNAAADDTGQPRVSVAVIEPQDGPTRAQCEGVLVPTVIVTYGDTITWDGARFTVTRETDAVSDGGSGSGGLD